ncbi:MAG: hypothetical protein LC624_01415 [Halobacteriales archaeon]|nr:hypothetical protein [Halobacteriales archaeon]
MQRVVVVCDWVPPASDVQPLPAVCRHVENGDIGEVGGTLTASFHAGAWNTLGVGPVDTNAVEVGVGKWTGFLTVY